MFHERSVHGGGRWLFGLSGIALGIIGLAWRDFAAVWQPIDNLGVAPSHRELVACIYAIAFLAAGSATLWKRTASAGLLSLAVLHFISALGWIPRIAGNAAILGVWNGFFELFSVTVAGAIGFAAMTSIEGPRQARIIAIGCHLYAICLVSFGATHLVALTETTAFVPAWIPPGQKFWAIATGVFYLLGALAIFTRVQVALATRLLVVMMAGFALLVWVPMLIAKPEHFRWAGTFITLALAGGAWVVADVVAVRAKQSLTVGPA